MDTETEAEIHDALNMLMQGRTTFIIAHRIQSLMAADLILVLERGRIVQRGTHSQLVNQPGVYRRVHDVQARIDEELGAGGEPCLSRHGFEEEEFQDVLDGRTLRRILGLVRAALAPCRRLSLRDFGDFGAGVLVHLSGQAHHR